MVDTVEQLITELNAALRQLKAAQPDITVDITVSQASGVPHIDRQYHEAPETN